MNRAFSLVELSIVLVILGLLTGGILAGQSLIRAAELRSVSSDYQRYAAALNSFRDKYFALPGDITNATKFWGPGTCPGANNTPSAGTATCDGNGDGQINYTLTSSESYRAWQHLASAGLVEGSYTGVCNSADCTANFSWAPVLGSNIPRSRISNAGWSIWYYGNLPISDMNNFEGNYGNSLFFGQPDPAGLTWLNALKPEEAWNLDVKMDDGRPATGKLTTYENGGGSTSAACSDLAPSATLSRAASAYALSNTSINCAITIKLGY